MRICKALEFSKYFPTHNHVLLLMNRCREAGVHVPGILKKEELRSQLVDTHKDYNERMK